MNIGVLGLGKLGLPLACVYDAAGHEVFAWDIDEGVRKRVSDGSVQTNEPDVLNLLNAGNVRIMHPDDIGNRCDFVFVIVPTPSLPTGDFNDALVREAIDSLGVTDATVILVSTVSPGTCEHLAEVTGVRLVYAPTLIALGSVVHNLTKPDAQLIGTENLGIGWDAQNIVKTVAPDARYAVMSYSSAELAKISFNAFITMKIAFANTIGQICDVTPFADVDDVLGVIGLDPRVGSPLCLTAGAAYGGPCFPRDNRAFAHAAGAIDTLANHVHELNEGHSRYIAELATHGFGREFTYEILGFSYKEGAEHRIESFGDKVAAHLEVAGGVEHSPGKSADVVVIAMPMRTSDYHGAWERHTRVIDVWRTHPYLREEVTDYIPFGRWV